MTTLNARANQAYRDMEAKLEQDDCVPNFVSERDAYEEGWETGYKAAAEELGRQTEPKPTEGERETNRLLHHITGGDFLR